MVPTQWITIISDILTIVLAILGFVDSTWHTALLTNPVTLTVLALLGAIGIHQTTSTTPAPTSMTSMTTTTSTSSTPPSPPKA